MGSAGNGGVSICRPKGAKLVHPPPGMFMTPSHKNVRNEAVERLFLLICILTFALVELTRSWQCFHFTFITIFSVFISIISDIIIITEF